MISIFKEIKTLVCLFLINIGIWFFEKEIKEVEKRALILAPRYQVIELLSDVKMFKEVVMNLTVDYSWHGKVRANTIKKLEKVILRLDRNAERCKKLQENLNGKN